MSSPTLPAARSDAVGDRTALADYLTGVLRQLRPLPPTDVDIARGYGRVLAADVNAPHAVPAHDQAAIDGYAARWEDLAGASESTPVHLPVLGEVTASIRRSVTLAPRSCFAVAAGALLPAGADVVVPSASTDCGLASVAMRRRPRRGDGVHRAAMLIGAGGQVAGAGTEITPALISLLAATGVSRVAVRPRPRVSVIATGDELFGLFQLADAPLPGPQGRIADALSPALLAGASDAGGYGVTAHICTDDSGRLRELLAEQFGKADLVVTSGGTGRGPGDVVRRALGESVGFIDVAVYPLMSLGFGVLELTSLNPTSTSRGRLPVVCLPGDPGAAMIGFELLARPVIRRLCGSEPVFRPHARAYLLDAVDSPTGVREFRPAYVTRRQGGGYAARPLPGGDYALPGLAQANGLLVLGEKVDHASIGSTVDVILIDSWQ